MKWRILATCALLSTICIAGCADGGGDTTTDTWDGVGDGIGDTDSDIDVDARPDDTGDGVEGDVPCVPTGDELCDGVDNDCDTEVDEGFDLSSDPENCGACNAVCRPEHATGGCTDASCEYECDEGWVDVNGSGVDGCEYECTASAARESETDGTCADGRDNDCDGRTDAGDGDCTACPPEFCNGLDDDCDGLTDEDFDIDFDSANCGACGRVCPTRDHAVPDCVLGACAVRCEAGWTDADGNPVNGCEAACVPSPTPDESICEGHDDDCDGRTDEDFVGSQCGEGLCRRSAVCVAGVVQPCTPRTPPTAVDTTCDGIDDDCDGRTDDDVTCACLLDTDCNDRIDCTTDTCVRGEGRCEHEPNAALCNDGSVCTGVEVCDLVLGCVAGTPIDCSDGIGCTDDLCDPLTGVCSWSPNHTRCSGGNVCDPPRSTDSSGCAPPATCTIDADCNDGDACNGLETCGPRRLCVPGVPVNCSDGITCTRDSCNPLDGSCSHIPPDVDLDTYPDAACGGSDCDDRDPARYPGQSEICDGIDQDCDAATDEGDICGPLPHAATSTCRSAQCVPNCDRNWGDCDGIFTNGCDTSLTTLANCGACGVPCDLPRAGESCATGVCRITSCDPAWGDCNATDADGCEASLTTLTNCGACGVPCAPAHATGATCITGACAFSGCEGGWGNCNGNGADGCERSLRTLTDCGGCGAACDLANATESCSTGTCTLVSCNPNWGNCDGSTTNGCETSLTTLANCGTCGTVCDLPNASESCSTGVCTLLSCSTGWGNCDGNATNGCETALTSLTNCGACGTACNPAHATGATCSTGSCSYAACESGWGNCNANTADGCETSLRTLTDCGGCAITCDLPNASESCSTGTCVLVSCTTGYGNCDSNPANGCEASLTTLTNCGACGTACSPANVTGPTCATGTCSYASCNSGWGNCDGITSNGCETSLRTTTDCGSCGTSCSLPNATATCSTGSCAIQSCNSGWGNCDGITSNGCETQLNTLTNCGACGAACSPAHATGASCSTGTCTFTACNSGWGNCDGNTPNGCETQLNTLANCGACGIVCNPANATGASCSTGTCTFTACNSGWGNCDGNTANGCETSLTTLTNCGACGTACNPANATGASCATGSCTYGACNSGWGNCDGNTPNGCETSLRTLTDCGSCGTGCSRANATATCSTGSCAIQSCNSGWGNCDAIDSNGCETALNTLANCGACGVSCSLPNATATCATGSCRIASCNSGWADVDGSHANGCECAVEAPEAGGTCATAYNLGTLADNAAARQTFTGKITSSTDVDCFTFTASDDADTWGDEFHVDIRFTANPSNQFQFSVFRVNCSTLVCASTVDSYDWTVDFYPTCLNPTGPAPCGEDPCTAAITYGYNQCIDDGAVYTFCVSRRTGFAVTCESYTIQISNGYY